MPQPQPRQQSRLNDIQMLQRHIMFKQIQELQRQQQLQGIDDARQQNYRNQQSMINKQVFGDQFPPLTPIHDASQRFMVGNMNLVHSGESSVLQGFSNGMGFPQGQSQALRSMGLVSPQLDTLSLYGTPVASVGNNLGQYSQLLGASHDSANIFEKGNNNLLEKPIMQSSAFSNSLRSNPFDGSSNQVYMQGGGFVSRQDFEEKNLFGQVATQGSNSEVLAGNLQHKSTLQKHASAMELNWRQEQAGRPGLFPEKMSNVVPSQEDICSLDPLEQKILFNVDDDGWDVSFGGSSNISTGDFRNTTENTDHMSALPSVQSGSWSALMQSAVGEASSSDTGGVQEEWSGLSYQNPDPSADNQPSNFVDSGKQHSHWVDNNLQRASSLSSKPEAQFNNSNMSTSFPGFQQPRIQFSLKQTEGMHLESSHESGQQSPKNNNKWLDRNPQQKQTIEGSQLVQRLSPLQSAWSGHNYEPSESDAHQRNISSYTNKTQAGKVTGATYRESNSMWKTDDNHLAGSFSNSVGGLELVDHIPACHQLSYLKDERIENMGNDQHHRSNSPQVCINSYKEASGTCEKQECSQRENSTDSHHSNASQHTITRHELIENVKLKKSDSRRMADHNQRPSGQIQFQLPQGLSVGYAEQFMFNGNVSNSGLDLEKGHLPDIQKNITEEVHSIPSVGSNISALFDRTSGFHGPIATAQTSQNMLELLHKVDSSKDHQLGMHLGSKGSIPYSEVPQAENPDEFAAKSCDRPFPSKFFGLRLSPPAQRLPISNCLDSSQSSPQKGNSSGTVTLAPPHPRNHLQNQHQPTAPVACQSGEVMLPGLGSSQDTSHLISTNSNGQPPILEANPVTRPFVMQGMSQQAGFSKSVPNVWKNAPSLRNVSGTESRKAPFILSPLKDSANSCLENTSTPQLELHSESYFNGQNETCACPTNSEGGLGLQGEQHINNASRQQVSSVAFNPVLEEGKLTYGQGSGVNSLLETNALASGSLMTNSHQQGSNWAHHSDHQSPKTSDLEVFGRSLKPSHIPSQNYSLLHQLHSVKNAENDSSEGVSSKYNGIYSDLHVQQATSITEQQLYVHTSGVRNVSNKELKSMSQTDILQTGEGKIWDFSSEMRDQLPKILSQPHHRDTEKEMAAGQNDSQGVSDATKQSQISLQMAPSWFKHYETLQNGQMLLMNDPRAAHQFNPGKIFENLQMNSSRLQANPTSTGQENRVWPTTVNTLEAGKCLSTPYMLPSDGTAQNLAGLRPKKRKTAAFELLQWHKEVTQGRQRFLHISLSDLEWAEASNRLIEKVDDGDATIEDAPLCRPKKRLTLTTQLIQHVFRAAPAVILSGDATSYHDSVVYFAARLALGDACYLSSSHMPCNISNTFSEKPKTPERTGDQQSIKVAEDLINRSNKLEADFFILDKNAYISDLRVESQELEKFSVINRFAKFHIRGQAGMTVGPSTCTGTTRAFPQRYITAVPMPRTVPEGAQCLSL